MAQTWMNTDGKPIYYANRADDPTPRTLCETVGAVALTRAYNNTIILCDSYWGFPRFSRECADANSVFDQVHILLHELLHLRGTRNYRYHHDQHFDQLSREQALNNADSFALYAYKAWCHKYRPSSAAARTVGVPTGYRYIAACLWRFVRLAVRGPK
ncbi:hypothetical protein FN846DRAFT_947748 [Sphaerosporella brunnea]|uniref:Lysine-specific metallo-endopeptidase domain-containing protein n=1 Tax=Sphaerosporella brunnea TaxID=1250544 RepID=A0A5J5EXM7_9PEZI|nr:hypothetical protein FN846DRAFT_947748 [Sphaerosporella brunnea]